HAGQFLNWMDESVSRREGSERLPPSFYQGSKFLKRLENLPDNVYIGSTAGRRHGGSVRKYADGGDIMSFMDRAAPAEEGIASGVMRPQGMNYTNYLPMNMDDQAYPEGGFQGQPRSPTEPPASFADRSQVIQDAIANGTMDPVGSNYTA